MVESYNLARARVAYRAGSTGDMTMLEQVLAPDVEWVFGGDHALTGTHRGRPAVFAAMGELLHRTSGTYNVQLKVLAEPEPGTVLACAHVTAEARGQRYDEDVVQRLEFRDGLIVRVRTFHERGHLLDAVIGPAVISLQPQDSALTS